IAQPTINSVSDSPDPVEVPGYNNITADITNATQAYVEIYYPNATLMGNYSMTLISPSTWYYNHSYAYPDPLGTYSYIVKAYNATGWASSATFTFVIQDTTSPTSSINPMTHWHNANIAIQATASDNYAVENLSLYYRYSSDNSTWGSWTFFGKDKASPWEWNFDFPDGEGYYEFYSIANDTAGNTEVKTTADENAAYDATAPSSSVDSMAYWYTSLPVVVTASASDALAGIKQVTLYYRYSIDNSSWGSWQSFATDTTLPWQWNFNAPNGDGYYELYTIAEDNASNVESSPVTADEKIGIDTTPPTTTISASPSSGNYITSSSVISLSASDAISGVDATYYRIWNGTWHPTPGTGVGKSNNFYLYSGPFSLTTAGTNYVEYYSVDHAGNEEVTHNKTYIVDNSPPVISCISADPSSQIVGGYVNISCCVVDESGVAEVYVEVHYPDGSYSNFSMYHSPCTTYYRNESYHIVGTYDFFIYAKDNLGHASKSATYHFTIVSSNNPPYTPSKPSGPTSGSTGYTYTYTSVTTDPDGDPIYYLFDWGDGSNSGWVGPYSSGSIGTASHSWSSSGTYYVRVKAKDVHGAESGWSPYLIVSIGPANNPPITSYILDPSSPTGKNGWYTCNVNVTLYATDPEGDTIVFTKYRIDGGSWITYTGTFTISTNGEHLLEFYSQDDKGSVESIKNVTIKIDKSKPSIYIQRPAQGYLYIFNREIWPLASGNTVVIGWIVVRAIATDADSDIENVSFYVDGVLQSIDKFSPYEWLWRGDIGWKNLYVEAYNKAGLKEQSDTIFLYIFSL
ncbi:MAG: hypothetical protein DRN11_02730, partial [Thermoplasmata archaeon]